jgi:cytochrome c oxidase subunit 2
MRIATSGIRPAVAFLIAAVTFLSGAADALAGTGIPTPWELGLQGMVTEVGHGVALFHQYLLWIITAICLLVAGLLIAIIFRFGEKRNPVASRTTHHTWLEVAWTILPVLILVAIAIPSFRLLRMQLVVPNADMVVKVTGYAWYWGYEYPQDQNGGFKFDSNMVDEKDLKPGQPRLLTVDNEMVVPVGKVVKVQVTAADVIHNFAVPSLGQRIDAIPGRLNETWFMADQVGVFHGQCSELCGNGHPYMPITVRVVSEAEYAAWLTEAKQKYAAIEPSTPVKLATAR